MSCEAVAKGMGRYVLIQLQLVPQLYKGVLDSFYMDVFVLVLSWKKPIVWFVAFGRKISPEILPESNKGGI
jgi:hypothetical protein